jgi:hypothetical protein
MSKQLSPKQAIAQFTKEQKAEAKANAPKKVRRTKDEIFAGKMAKVKSTGNVQLDGALQKIVQEVRAGSAQITKQEDGQFAVTVGKVTATVGKVPAGKVQKVQLQVAGLTIGGSYANVMHRLAVSATRAPAAPKAPAFNEDQVSELASLLAD